MQNKNETLKMEHSISTKTRRMTAHAPAIMVFVCLCFVSDLLLANGITIGSGGSINVGQGSINLGCKDIQVEGELQLGSGSLDDVRHASISGTVDAQSGSINLTGDWTNLGTVNPGTSAVNMNDGCSTTSSTISGPTSFYDWSVMTTSGKQLNFSAGETQDALNSVKFNGTDGSLLKIRSTVADSPAFFQLAEAGTQNVSFVDVRDNHAPMPGQFMAPGFPEEYNSVDSGGNFRWFGSYRFNITVYKDFNDGNPADVMVHKECNTGLPLNVSIGIREGNPITFVTTNIDSGATNCAVTETAPDGYTVVYATEEDGPTNPDGCIYNNVEQGAELECFIFNSVEPVQINVQKLWMDEHPEFQIPMIAEAQFECTGEAELDTQDAGTESVLWFLGDDSFDTFNVLPHWNGQTSCTITEQVSDSSVESDDSECAQIPVLLGQATDPAAGEYDCTIYNTRLYEGIPVLSKGNMLLMALLILSFGLFGLRRIQ